MVDFSIAKGGVSLVDFIIYERIRCGVVAAANF